MKESLRPATSLVVFALLCLTWLLLPGVPVSATREPSRVSTATSIESRSTSQNPEQQVIVRVTVGSDHERQLLAGREVDILKGPEGREVYAQTTAVVAEALRLEGWVIKVLYARGEDGAWIYLDRVDEGCTYTLNPTSKSIAEGGGTSSFVLTTDSACEWTAFSNQPWITVDGSLQGTGPRTFFFTIDPNPNPTPRSGGIFVTGQTFMVFQGALFADVPRTHQFYSEIGKISARGITVGCGGGNFCPDEPVTREQMAAFIIRALGEFDPPPPAMQRFGDVPPSNLFYAFIEEMAVRQITLGCGGGNYCPTEPVTREQAAAFIIRALGELNPPVPTSQRFADVPPSNQFYNFIDRLGALGITQGCGGGNFCPTLPVTRAQMAAFLVRAFNL
jgi:S-layer homology domain/Putative binding domain, N-terminal